MDPRMLLPGSLEPNRASLVSWLLRSWVRPGGIGLLLALVFVSALAGTPLRRNWTSFAYPAAFEHISVEHGLSQSTVHCMVQDRKGFLWIGTDSGLNRYDGFHFLVLRHEKNNPGSLRSNSISALLLDRQGQLWISAGGLSRLDPDTLKLVHYRPGSEPGAMPSEATVSLAQDPSGNLWISTMDKGVCMLPADAMPPHAPRFQTFEAAPGDPLAPPQGYVPVLFVDQSGTLWTGGPGGIRRLKGRPAGSKAQFESFQRDPARPEYQPPPNCIGMGQDAQGRIWAGNWDGLYLCDPDHGVFRRYTASARPDGLSSNITRIFYLDRTGDFWIGADGGGLLKLLPGRSADEAPRFQRFQANPNESRSLSGNGIDCIYEDHSGALWVSAYQAGLNKLILNPGRGKDRDRPTLYPFRNNAADPHSLSGNTVAALGQDRFGNLWVGTDGSGLNRVVPPPKPEQPLRFERFSPKKDKPGSLPADVVLSICLDSRQQLWMGTFMAGLLRVEQTSAKGEPRFIQILGKPEQPDSLSDNFIRVILDDGGDRLWIGTNDGGLNLFDTRTQRAKRFYLGPNKAFGMRISKTISALAKDAQGTLWMATPDGLNRLNPRTGECRGYVAGGEGSLSDSNVLTLHIDASNTLWVGTEGGLDKAAIPAWDGPEPRFTHFGLAEGLPSNVINSLVEDQEGQFWIATDRSLCRFDPKTGLAHPFTWQSELRRSEFIKNACFRSDSGEVLFGSNDGFYLFHPADIVANKVLPRIAITGLQVLNRPIPPQERISWDPADTDSQEITLQPKDSIFSVDFAALHFGAPERNQYAYMLEGLDSTWKEAGYQHSVSYTTLPPGNYVLRVRTSNCDGLWNQKGLRLRIHVLPPWYKTWWFRAMLVGALLWLVYAIIRIRLKVLSHRNRILEQLVSTRTQELAEANEGLAEANEALRNQSLTDPLTGLRNRRFLDACMPEDIAQVQRLQRDVNANALERMRLNVDVLFIMVDIDHFKLVNDRHGHHAGDLVLQQMSEILRNAMRTSDTITRWGGEEFLIVARNAARTEATIPAERIRLAMEAHPFDIGEEQPIHCTCSLGFSVFPLLPNEMGLFSWEKVVEIADACLYAAKHSGRNAWVGLVPETLGMGQDDRQTIPRTVAELIKAQIFPVVTSLKTPIQWENDQ